MEKEANELQSYEFTKDMKEEAEKVIAESTAFKKEYIYSKHDK